ncbi:MAG: hypothetical protein C5B51_06970 [Terriglobia bacterium]|nr:MAG: hypothetical protein C5B51_06970 [Terriglobia bacterium]
MPVDNWERIQEIFLAAAELSGAARSEFLDGACQGDIELRAEVESLLRSDTNGEASLDAAIRSEASSLLEGPPIIGLRLGAYRVVREIGRGGMGTVYLAERDDDVYHKKVAIKVVKRGMDTADVLGRFRHERQILADLDHPYIARLIDGGTTPDGRPFFVMEHVEGRPVDVYCREEHLGVEARLELFLRVCDAVAYAHGSLVVHRDLKPGNILVTPEGVPKLLDFGVAKLLGSSLDARFTVTNFAARPLTPEYASPEQVLGRPITTATDIYSLGAILYELLTGTRAREIPTRTPTEIERVVCREDIARPSSVARRLDADLDNIVLMAMQKDQDRRYPSVSHFAQDIQRYLRDLPVMARKETIFYSTRKFVRRNRLAVGAAIVAGVSLIVGSGFALHEAAIARERYNLVRRLATTFVFDVEAEARKIPGSTRLRQVITRTGLEYLDSLARSAAGDWPLQRELAAAYARIGDVQGSAEGANLGDIAGALASYNKARNLLNAVLERTPGDREAELERLRVLQQIGMVETVRSGSAHAVETYQEGVRRAEAAIARYPGDRAFEERLANLYQTASSEQRVSGDLPHALTNAYRAIELFERLAAANPQDRALQMRAASVYSQAGMVEARMGQLDTALAHYRRNVEGAEALHNLEPLNPMFTRELAMAYAHLGDVLGNPLLNNLGNTQGSIEAYTKVAALMKHLSDGDPADQQALADYGIALQRIGLTYPASRSDEKLAQLEQAYQVLSRAARNYPESLEIGLPNSVVQVQIGDLLIARGETAKAVEYYRRSLAGAETMLRLHPTHETTPRQVVTVGRKAAEQEARAGNRAEAVAIIDRVLKAGAAAQGPSRSIVGRSSLPRSYAAAASVYQILDDRPQALEWNRKAAAAWHAIQHQPDFSAAYQKEMAATEAALEALSRLP